MIPVTKPFFPNFKTYQDLLKDIWQNEWLTNRGPLALRLETEICEKLGLKNLLFVSNGTVAIQLVMKALNISGEVITTPFSYVATTTSILWENCKPVFCDIDPETFCMDAGKIEGLVTSRTTAILATHVYGIPCDVEKINKIAEKHNLKVIYDAAHAFGVKYKGKSILNYGDASTCSFHATKLFHTGEGGSITTNDPEVFRRTYLYHAFGHLGDDYISLGINGKNSELHAAMGLCNLPMLDEIINERKKISTFYKELLKGAKIKYPHVSEFTDWNYGYFPVVFESEALLIKIKDKLTKAGINTRRYFFPSLNMLPYLENNQSCPVSEKIASCVLCLPIYYGLEAENIERIAQLVLEEL